MKLQENSEVVISGIGAKLPESNNIKEFGDKLFSKSVLPKNDLVRYIPGIMEKPYLSGRLPDSNRFDYTFFGVSSKLVNNCDPQMTQMLERSYEAIMDAGVNPVTLKGHNICVMAASTLSDSEILRTVDGTYHDGYSMVGHARTMMANRISYCFNFTGPSYNINAAWTSAVQGLEKAAVLVAQGLCEAAIVTASNVLFLESVETEYISLDLLSPDGKCSPFDSNANGFVRSEGSVTFFLQRAQDAKRHYCTVLNTQVQYLGEKPSSFLQINPQLEQFYKDFYEKSKVNPSEVSYIEAFGFCNKDKDAQELNIISNVFLNGKSPVIVGSVNGNVGNTECPSGFVSLVKSIIAMETGVIPPTVGYNSPNPKVPSLLSGKLKIVTEPTTLTGDLIAVNCLNYNGNVGHILVKRHNKTKKTLSWGELPPDGLPRLVILQTRNEEGARAIIKKLSKMPVDTEYISLINNIFKTSVPNYLWRSYITLPATENTSSKSKIEKYPDEKYKLWFVFSGMGSQWPGMGRELLQIPLFAASIDKCDKVLAPLGIDIRYILTTEDPETFDNILNCFVGIAAIQIGLVDILNAIGVTPDGIIGHSVGELGCAYADGCLTAEEMVLAAYYRGKASLESENIKGMMAAIGVGFNDIKNQLPPTIDVACHNSANSCTLSGPTKDVLNFVNELKSRKVFAKAVSAGGIAFHSRYIKEIGHKLLTYLRQVIKNPKPRSSRWISTSMPQAQWDTPEAQLCSAEYHTNNLLGSVLFEEGCQFLPRRVILLEIAPHGLLQAILRRSIGSNSISLTMTNRTTESNTIHLLDVLGKLHNQGMDMDINALYPPVQYPVSRGTPNLAEFATWDHSEKFFQFVEGLSQMIMRGATEMMVDINQKNKAYELWTDHCIKGSVVVPLSQLLVDSWKFTFETKELDVDHQCVIIEDVIISDSLPVKGSDHVLLVTLSPATFQFELSVASKVSLKANVIITGRIREVAEPLFSLPTFTEVEKNNEEVIDSEIYSILAYYGCHLGPQFQLIKKIILGKKACVAQVQWTGHWVTFLDALLKITVFVHSEKKLTLMQPSSFNRLTIKPSVFEKWSQNSLIDVYYDTRSKRLVCEAVELCGITLSPTHGDNPPAICWKEVKVQAHESTKLSIEEFLSASIQVASQTRLSPWAKKSSTLNIVKIKESNGISAPFINILLEVIKSLSSLSIHIKELDFKNALEYLNNIGSQACLLVGYCDKAVTLLDTTTNSNVYCLTMRTHLPKYNNLIRCIMTYQSKDGHVFSLLKRKSIAVPLQSDKVFEVLGPACLEELDKKMALDKSSDQVVVVSSAMTPRDLLPILANKLYARRICTVFILDKKAPTFSTKSAFYNNEITVGLPVNILSKGEWGTLITSNIDAWPQNKNVDRLMHSSDKILEVKCTGLNINTFTLNQGLDINKMELNCADFSGYMGKERVMGVAKCDSVFSLTPDPVLRWPVPSGWTLEDAASVPVIYTLAYYCVLMKGSVKAGEDVLVNAGMSPIGQAVIGITLQIGANVFTSVTNGEEAASLLNLYPSLNPRNVILLNSQDIFVAITKLTAGKGVKVIVNCLRGNDMTSSLKVIGYYSRFVHLGQIKVEDRESIGLEVFLKSTFFFGVSLEDITTCNNSVKVNLQNALQKGLHEGVVKPLQKATFSFKDEANALKHLGNRSMFEKTILINDTQNKLYPRKIEDFSYTSDQSVVILGTKSDLWMDVADWLVLRGARAFTVFTEEDDGDDVMNTHSSWFCRLTERYNATFCLLPRSRLLTKENAMIVLEEVLKFRQISHIFCVQQDENSSAMRNLEFASRTLVPKLRQFLSLLGHGAAVCESRAERDLPVCSVQSDLPLKNPAHVLPYLSTLPADSFNSRFFLVNDNVNDNEKQDYLDIQVFLPMTLDELCQMGDDVTEVPVFREVLTRSPGHHNMRHTLLPMFVISALGPQSLKPLLRHLIHPAFCCSLPAIVTSVNEYAEVLLQGVLEIQKQGTFNLVGCSWGSPVAFVLANLLEARGHHVRLFLLEGTPIFIQNLISSLCESNNCDLGPSLLVETLKLSTEVLNRISEFKMWEDQLKTGLLECKIAPDVQQCVSRALTSLYSQLNALKHHETPSQQFHGELTLITYKPVSAAHKDKLFQFCEEIPQIVTIEDESYSDFLANFKTASVINKNVAYEWKL